ncbi:hypothetical protein [Micromonospora sp. NPDC049301]|uniref:hypothetical protein n=1 Tax=Micromonospora sp. NPDC049301 TaxID=3155723 RepID=UPI00342C2AF0
MRQDASRKGNDVQGGIQEQDAKRNERDLLSRQGQGFCGGAIDHGEDHDEDLNANIDHEGREERSGAVRRLLKEKQVPIRKQRYYKGEASKYDTDQSGTKGKDVTGRSDADIERSL